MLVLKRFPVFIPSFWFRTFKQRNCRYFYKIMLFLVYMVGNMQFLCCVWQRDIQHGWCVNFLVLHFNNFGYFVKEHVTTNTRLKLIVLVAYELMTAGVVLSIWGLLSNEWIIRISSLTTDIPEHNLYLTNSTNHLVYKFGDAFDMFDI